VLAAMATPVSLMLNTISAQATANPSLSFCLAENA